MALTGYVLRLDMSEVRETLRLLANATNNINQIAKRANETRSIYANDMIQLREEVGNLRSQVSDVMKVFGKIRKLMEL
jgi:predicted transcriptional regulator